MRPQVVIVATILLNAAQFTVNFVVAIESGSRAVLAQAIYTVTDLIGSGLLLWGLHASMRPPDYQHPFGRGKERFFWAFVSILVTFTTAGLLALVTGIEQYVSPDRITHIGISLLVVGGTLLASVGGITITLRELRIGRQTLRSLLASANQGLKSIFYQDLVTIAGCAVAFVGLLVVYRTGDFTIDGATAAVEGMLLITTGFVLTSESREYLIGRAVAPALARSLLVQIERDPQVRKVRGLQSMLLGPDDALLTVRINFQDGLTTDQIESAIDRLTLGLKETNPILRHIVIEPES